MDWKKFSPFEDTPTTKKVDVSKPLGPQIAGDTGKQPIQVYNPQPVNFAPQPAYNYGTPQIQLSPEDQKKWMDFLTNIYTTARKANTVFDDFETQVESLTEAMPAMPDAQRIQAVYAIMAKKGATKAIIVDAANSVLKAVNDSVPSFQKTQQQKIQEGVTDLQQQIADKNQQIVQLQQDIAQLNQSINDNQGKIAVREYGFNSCYSQVVAKVTADVNNINNYIVG